MKDKIDNQILNSSGVRDTARVLGINKNTVIAHLKKTPNQVNPYLLDLQQANELASLEFDISYSTEWDEFWSYVRLVNVGLGIIVERKWYYHSMAKWRS